MTMVARPRGPFWSGFRASALLLMAVALSACEAEEAAVPPEPVEIGTQEGMQGPDLTGSLADGGAFALGSPVDDTTILVFYGSADCGLCRVQLDNIQANLPGYRNEHAEVVGVTLDPPERSQRLVAEAGISYPVVSVDSAQFREWGALDAEHGTALPATFVLDDSGIVRFRHIGRNASDRTTDADVLTIVHRLSDP